MIRIYVEYLYPGVIVSESQVYQVKQDSPSKMPEAAFAFRSLEREEVPNGNEILTGPWKNHSGWTYVGQEYTLAEMKRWKPWEHILISNMEINKWDRIVWTKFQQAMPLNPEDKVIPA